MNIILYLLNFIKYRQKIICQLLNFICKYIPLKQWAFDDSHSPKYQKFKVDVLPRIISYEQDWKWNDLIPYYETRYGKTIKPMFRRTECDIPDDCTCPVCNAPKPYLSWNDGRKKSQIRCKVCLNLHSPSKDNRFSKSNKLHYIYREFLIDFFQMDLNSLPKNASSLKFRKFDQNILGLCLSYKINLGLSLRKTAQALHDIHGIKISHQQVANYLKTAAVCIKPFVDNYNYDAGTVFTADETYIKIRGIKGYIWFIMDAARRSIIGYQISDNRGVGPCIMAMRIAFKLDLPTTMKSPKNFVLISR